MSVELNINTLSLGIIPSWMWNYTIHLLEKYPNKKIYFNLDLKTTPDTDDLCLETVTSTSEKYEYLASEILRYLTMKSSEENPSYEENVPLALRLIVNLVASLETPEDIKQRFHDDASEDVSNFENGRCLDEQVTDEDDEICWSDYKGNEMFEPWLDPDFFYPSLHYYLRRVQWMRPTINRPFHIVLGDWELYEYSHMREMCGMINDISDGWTISKIQQLLSKYSLACRGHISSHNLQLDLFEYDDLGKSFKI